MEVACIKIVLAAAGICLAALATGCAVQGAPPTLLHSHTPPRASLASASGAADATSSTAPATPAIEFTAVQMFTATSGWAASRAAIYHTDGGARTWSNVTPQDASLPENNPLNGRAFFLSATRAWVLSASARHGTCTVYATSDGGASWTASSALALGSAECLGPSQLAFAGPREGLLAFGPEAMQNPFVALYRSLNGGGGWHRVNHQARRRRDRRRRHRARTRRGGADHERRHTPGGVS